MLEKNEIKIVYMGTPEFAVPALEAIIQDGYNVPLVVTQPDKARDRGKRIQPSPVKQAAMAHGISVLQPERLKGNIEVFAQLKEMNPDLIVVAAYGKILPKEILEIPRFGCINIHGSLLPKYRGAAPIQRSIIAGEQETGVTIMYMEEGLDTGDMLSKEVVSIEKKTSAMLHDELSVLGAQLLVRTLPGILDNSIRAEEQNHEESSYAPIITKAEGEIDFFKSAREIECLIRGMNPWPSAFTLWGDKTIKIWEADIIPEDRGLEPGTIVDAEKDRLWISCGRGILSVKNLQLQGRKAMNTKDFLRGNKIEKGTILGRR